jgi:hypothetical protein
MQFEIFLFCRERGVMAVPSTEYHPSGLAYCDGKPRRGIGMARDISNEFLAKKLAPWPKCFSAPAE